MDEFVAAISNLAGFTCISRQSSPSITIVSSNSANSARSLTRGFPNTTRITADDSDEEMSNDETDGGGQEEIKPVKILHQKSNIKSSGYPKVVRVIKNVKFKRAHLADFSDDEEDAIFGSEDSLVKSPEPVPTPSEVISKEKPEIVNTKSPESLASNESKPESKESEPTFRQKLVKLYQYYSPQLRRRSRTVAADVTTPNSDTLPRRMPPLVRSGSVSTYYVAQTRLREHEDSILEINEQDIYIKPSPVVGDDIPFVIPTRQPLSEAFKHVRHRMFTREIDIEQINPETYQPDDSVSNSLDNESIDIFDERFNPNAPPTLHFRAKYDRRKSHLVVHLVCAKNLPAMDLNGLSDPYVKIYLTGENRQGQLAHCGIHQTRVYYKTLNPVFNEAFEIPILTKNPEFLSKVILRLFVYDFDFFTRDDLIGCVSLPHLLDKLSPNTFVAFNEIIDETAEEEETGGEILIDLEMLPLTGRVNVNLIKIRNISIPGITCNVDDWFFAKLELKCSSPTNRCKSKVVKKRTDRYHAEVRRATDPPTGSIGTKNRIFKRKSRPTIDTDGDVMTTTGNWLEVNFNEQFNFSLRARGHSRSEKIVKSPSDGSDTEGKAAQNEKIDCRLTISVYCQRGKRRENNNQKSSPVGCGLMQSILPSMKQQLGTCSVGTTVSGLGGEHWEEAERAANQIKENKADDANKTTISRWHSLIVGRGDTTKEEEKPPPNGEKIPEN